MKKKPQKRQICNKLHRRDKSQKMNAHQRIFCERLVSLINQCQIYKIEHSDLMHMVKGLYGVIVTELNYMLPKMHQKQLQSEEVLIKLADLAYSDLILKYIQYSGLYQHGDEVCLNDRLVSDFVLTHYRKSAMEYLQDRYAALLPVRRYKPNKADLLKLQLDLYETDVK